MTTDRTLLLAPGRMLGPYVPMLYFAGEAAEARGAVVEPVYWPAHPAPEPLGDGVASRVARVLEEALDRVPGAPVVAAKSLGTMTAPVVARRRLPAIMLTPVLTGAAGTDPEPFRRGAAEATRPWLLVGGTADPLWDGDYARGCGHQVLEVPDADHSMQLPGPLAASVAVLGTVVAAIEAYLDTVW